MSKHNPRLGGLLVLVAAVLWGSIPLFGRTLYAQGIDPISVAAARALIAALIYLLCALLFGTLKGVRSKDLPFFALYGLCAVTGTYAFYFMSISRLSIAMASMLLYTGPAFVILFSRVLYREPITKDKLGSLLLTFAGCFLVVRGYDPRSLTLNLTGIALGLLSGLCYSSFTLFGKRGLTLYSSATNITLASAFGALFFFVIRPPWAIPLPGAFVGINYGAVAILGSVLPYFLYLRGMEKGLDGSSAGLLCYVEPIVATLIGVFVFGDPLEFLQIVGIVVTLAGAAISFFRAKAACPQP